MNNCKSCKQPIVIGDNVFTPAGIKEVPISGICEVCFDDCSLSMIDNLDRLSFDIYSLCYDGVVSGVDYDAGTLSAKESAVAAISNKYEAVTGEEIKLVEATEYTCYDDDFVGYLQGFVVLGNSCYIAIMDKEENGFYITPDKLLKDWL